MIPGTWHLPIFDEWKWMAQQVKNAPAMQEIRERWVWSLGQEDPLEKEMATHSSILTWKIPWVKEPGGLESVGSQRVGHDWATRYTLSVLCFGSSSYILSISLTWWTSTLPVSNSSHVIPCRVLPWHLCSPEGCLFSLLCVPVVLHVYFNYLRLL